MNTAVHPHGRINHIAVNALTAAAETWVSLRHVMLSGGRLTQEAPRAVSPLTGQSGKGKLRVTENMDGGRDLGWRKA